MKDEDHDRSIDEAADLLDQCNIDNITDGVQFTSDHSMRLPFQFFEFTKVIDSVDKRERFCALILHALSGSSADGKNYTIDLLDDGKRLHFRSHMDKVAETFSDSRNFEKALRRKLSFRDNGGVLDLNDVAMITNAFDTKIRDETENYNNYQDWSMDFVLPTDRPGRDIIMRFPVLKVMKAGKVVEGLKRDVLHSFVTIVRLDWEDIESAKVKTPSKGILLDIDEFDSPMTTGTDDDSVVNVEATKKRRLRQLTNDSN